MNLYDIKQRNPQLPLAICLAEPSQVEQYSEAGHLPSGLLQELLPGPVTIVLRRKQTGRLAKELNPGVPTIGMVNQWQKMCIQLSTVTSDGLQ